MQFAASDILAILDQCDTLSRFPVLDNGYVYLAASRLSLYRSAAHWALVIEIFGFSPRVGVPDLCVYTFANQLRDRNASHQYVSTTAYEQYLANNPHNEARFFSPVDAYDWHDIEDSGLLAENITEIVVRGKRFSLPQWFEYDQHTIELELPPRVHIFELCRFLATVARDDVLGTREERKTSVFPEMVEILRLEAWHHPDSAAGEQPSSSQAFQQFADVLVSGDAAKYLPSQPPNTHWQNWPKGGTL